MIIFLSLALLIQSTYAEDPNVAAFVKKHSRRLTEDQVFYRWQSTAAGENLARIGTMTEAAMRHFDSQTGGISAGPGIYIAGSELSSAMYMPPEGGNIIEIRIPKGTRVLDLEDSAVEAALERANIRETAIHHHKGGSDGLLLKYQDDWYVGRNLTDRAKFQFYPGPQHKPDQIAKTLLGAYEAGRPAQAQQIADQIRKHRPDVIETIAARGEVTPALVAILPPERLPALVERALERGSKAQTLGVLRALAKTPQMSLAVAQDQTVLRRVLAKFADLDLDASHNSDAIQYLAQLARRAPDDVARPILANIASRTVRDPWLRRDWPALAQRLVPIMEHLDWTPAERATFAKDIGDALDHHGQNLMHATTLGRVARTAKIDDPALLARLVAAEKRDHLLLTAATVQDVDDVRAVLRAQPDAVSFKATAAYLENHVPTNTIRSAVNEMLQHEPAVLTGLVKTPADFEAAAEIVKKLDATFEPFYHAALSAGAVERQAFVHGCLIAPQCRPVLVNTALLDKARIFRAPADARALARDLYPIAASGGPSERLLIDTIMKSVDRPEDFAMLAKVVSLAYSDPAGRASVLNNIRRIGLDRFRPNDLVDIAGAIGANDAVKREFMTQIVRNAASTDDLVTAAHFAKVHDLKNHGLDDDMLGKYRSYMTMADDTAYARQHGLMIPPGTRATGTECLNALTRALGQ